MGISTQLEELQKKKTELRMRGEHQSLLANKSLTVWILGFCTFAAALTTFHALLLQTQYGPTATFESYLISPFTGPIQVATYFWASLILTGALFGATSYAAFRYSFEFDTLMKLNSVLNHNTKQLVALLSEKNKAMEEALRQSLSQSMNIRIDNLRQEIEAEMGKQRKNIQTLDKLASTVMDIKRKLKETEKRLNPKPKVTINDKPQKVKGIGPSLAQKLKVIGVTTVGELITMDPTTIAVGTQLSEDKAKLLQARAKMLMIPGLDEKQIELLEQIVITSK
ncbi:MAG: DUF4332 domain-containing protein [Candidatus Bathyarchaeia archaeon]